jgi:predicted O-linked N-acetylglucosamine transferase (SPINDLY family)
MTAENLYQLATEHYQAGRFADAESLYRQLLTFAPEHADAMNSLAVLAQRAGRGEEAEHLLRRAIAARPDEASFHHNLALVLEDQGRLEEAIEQHRQVLGANPQHAPSQFNLGFALVQLGRYDEAMVALSRALELRQDVAQAHFVMGSLLRERGEMQPAVWHLRRAVELQPNMPEAHTNLGIALRASEKPDEAIAEYRAAITLRPDDPEGLSNLGQILTETGRFDESLDCFRKAEALGGGPRVASNLLYSILFNPKIDAHASYQEHVRWNQTHAAPLAAASEPQKVSGQPERFRIGYVSPNFRNHVVGRFLLPLFCHHDHVEFEIICYSDVTHSDSITGQLRACAGIWRETAGLSDEELARLIRADRIDILVDLNMHMEGSRLLAYARRPAPVQATYLAYAGTTGLETMDWRLTDSYLEPSSTNEAQPPEFRYSERSMLIGRSYWCYPMPLEAPTPGPLPALAAGHVSFGCLNAFPKINAAVLELWAAILRRVSGSRLILHAPEGSHREAVTGKLLAEQINPQRVQLVARTSGSNYFALYRSIDIALDPFPYPGGTTSCDALWMGVPVVTLSGQSAISRAGVSILSNVGLPDLVARTPSEYLQLAIELASDLPRLAGLRGALREQMHHSPLMDAKRFARDIEEAYRRMWTERLLGAGRADDQS